MIHTNQSHWQWQAVDCGSSCGPSSRFNSQPVARRQWFAEPAITSLWTAGPLSPTSWEYDETVWVKKADNSASPHALGDRVLTLVNGSLSITNLDPESDAGVYTCFLANSQQNLSIKEVHLVIKSPPSAVSNLTVIPHSVFALVTWTLKENQAVATGGSPIQRFVLTYSMISSHLSEELPGTETCQYIGPQIIDDIPSTSISRSVFGLKPNSTYSFSICAVNELGFGDNLTAVVDTLYVEEEIEETIRLYEESRQETLSSLVK